MGVMTTPATDDYITTLDSSEAAGSKNKKMTFANLLTWIGASSLDHGGLSGLTDDDHPQYTKNIIDDTTITVGSGKDYATIQEAVDSLDGYIVSGGATVTIAVDAGTYNESVVTENFFVMPDSAVVILGDERADAGITHEVSAVDHTTDAGRLIFTIGTITGTYTDWTNADDFYLWPFGTVDIHSVTSATSCRVVDTYNTARYGDNTAGELAIATVTEIIAGERYRYTFSDTPHGSIVAGMKLNVYGAGTAGNNGLFWIAKVSYASKYIEVVNASGVADAVASGNAYAISPFVCFKPNRMIVKSTAGTCFENRRTLVQIDGLWLQTSTGSNCNSIYVRMDGYLTVRNCGILAEDYGVFVDQAGSYATLAGVSVFGGTYGVSARNVSQCDVSNVRVLGSTNGYLGWYGGFIQGSGSAVWAIGCTTGYYTQLFGAMRVETSNAYCNTSKGYYGLQFSFMRAHASTAKGNETGFIAQRVGYLVATSTNANNLGNTTNYSPGTTDTLGTDGTAAVGSVITFT